MTLYRERKRGGAKRGRGSSHRYYIAYGLGLDTGHFRVHSALRRKLILPLDTAWFSIVTVLPNTKTARIKGVLRRDNALSTYRL